MEVRRADGGPVGGVPVSALASLSPVAVGLTGPDGVAELALPAGAPLEAVLAARPGVGFGYDLLPRPDRGPDADPAPLPDRVAVRLSPTFTHRVRLVARDPATGELRPVAGEGASVWYVRQPGRADDINLGGTALARTTTGANGEAVFDWLPTDFERAIPLWLGGDGHGRLRGRIDAENPAETQTVELEPLATLAGRVTNPDGSPAAGVMVRAEGTYSNPIGEGRGTENEREVTFTDADGRFTTRARGGAVYLVVPLPGSPTVFEETDPPSRLAAAALGSDGSVVVPPGGVRDDLDFTLSEGTLLTGTVRAGGGPAADVTVLMSMKGEFPDDRIAEGNRYPHRLSLPRWTETDDAGRYGFRVGPGTYELSADYKAGLNAPLTVAGGEGDIVNDFALPAPPAPVEITGTVVDDVGLTLAGVTVAAGAERSDLVRGPAPATTRSGPDGAFAVAFTPRRRSSGAYLTATGADEVRGPLYGYLDLRRQFVGRAAPATTGVTLVARRLAVLTGTATDAAGQPLAGAGLRAHPADVSSQIFPVDPLNPTCVSGPNGRFLFRDALVGLPYDVRYQAEERGSHYLVLRREIAAGAVTDAGAAGNVGAVLQPLDERMAAAFAEPADPVAALATLRADAALLERRALVVTADPASEAGRDLFALLYDDRAVGRAADAAYLTRCLAADRPTRTADLSAVLGGEVDPGAAALTVLNPDGAVVARHAHAAGDRDGLLAFLKANGG